jgi:hypothetical protein
MPIILSECEIERYYESRVPKLHKTGEELRGPCPLHKGKRDSLAINPETGEWFCHSGCARGGSIFEFEAELTGSNGDAARAAVFELAGWSEARHIVKTYDYEDESGTLLYQCVRYEPKDFRQRRPDGRGRWIWNLKGRGSQPGPRSGAIANPVQGSGPELPADSSAAVQRQHAGQISVPHRQPSVAGVRRHTSQRHHLPYRRTGVDCPNGQFVLVDARGPQKHPVEDLSPGKKWGLWAGENPTLGVRVGRKKFVREKRLLKVEEMQVILVALPDHLRFLILILFGFGLRISEALGLRWRDVDFEQAQIKIRRRWYRGDLSEEDETKSEASHATLRLCGPLLAEFRVCDPGPAKRDAFLFLGPDGATPCDDRDLLRYEFRPVLKRLGLYYEGFGWHAFRRQNITWKQQLGGATPLEAQKAARHASLDIRTSTRSPIPSAKRFSSLRMFEALLGTGKDNDKVQ